MKLPMHLKRIAVEEAIANGARIDPDRFHYEEGEKVIKAAITIACHEQPVIAFPSDWWQAFKARWFPDWLIRKTPVRCTEVVAVSKLPDLIPPEGLGSQFVVMEYLDFDEYLARINNGTMDIKNKSVDIFIQDNVV